MKPIAILAMLAGAAALLGAGAMALSAQPDYQAAADAGAALLREWQTRAPALPRPPLPVAAWDVTRLIVAGAVSLLGIAVLTLGGILWRMAAKP